MKNKLKVFVSLFAFLSTIIFCASFGNKVLASALDDEPVDVIIKYIDLTDKHLKREGVPQIKKDYDNEELRYALRSIDKNMPWVRKTFIVMPNEKVRFLKDKDLISDKIVYVKDKDLVGFDSASCTVYELNLWRMGKFGCSKNFIYMNDDYFIGKPVKKSDFFYEENGKVVPYVLYNKGLGRGKNAEIHARLRELSQQVNSTNKNAHSSAGFQYQKLSNIEFLYNILGKNIITPAGDYHYFPHNAQGENIDELKEVHDWIKNKYKYADDCLQAKCRRQHSLVQQTVYTFYILNKYNRKVNNLRGDYIDLHWASSANLNVPLFCINTGGNMNYTDADYAKARAVMNKAFPIPTKYEKQDLADGVYVIESALQKNKVLDIAEASSKDNANLQLWDRNGTNAQKFRVSYDKTKGFYTISPLCSGKNLGVRGTNANILQCNKNNNKTQKWHLISAGRGYFYISSNSNSLFADVSISNTRNGTNVRCWEPNGTNAQKFRFIRQ